MHPSCQKLVKALMVDRLLTGPQALTVIDIGSYDVNGTLRPVVAELLPNAKYTGLDRRPGPNVDLVHDICETTPLLGRFDLVLSANMLEHCSDLNAAAGFMLDLIKPGGWLIVTTPWDIPIHEPPDRWRVSVDGIDTLFKKDLERYESGFYKGDCTDTWCMGRAKEAA